MKSSWTAAAHLAAQTPPTRNRCVDFLRATPILVVVSGHWLMAAPWVDADGSHISHLLAVSPWSQWLTWALQVMPIFFFVGGYANGISWDAACRDGKPYRGWLSGRLRRLLAPVLALLLFWAVAAAIAHRAGVPAEMIRVGSQIALVPTWFLAVYTLVVLLVPISRAAWKSVGMASFWIPTVFAGLVDGAYFVLDLKALGWVNYLLVWGGVHQLGYAWIEGRFSSRVRSAVWCIVGLVVLVALTEHGPWPRSLVGVPGEKISNTIPPHIPLLALAAFQFGVVMLTEPLLARLLARSHAWTATVLVNGVIMTVFLWHSTVMMLLFGLAILLGGIGLGPTPGTIDWWVVRVPWLVIFALGLLPFVWAFGVFERPAKATSPSPAGWRMVVGSALLIAGLAMLALDGVGGPGWLGVRIVPLLLPLAGAELAGFGVVAGILRCKGKGVGSVPDT